MVTVFKARVSVIALLLVLTSCFGGINRRTPAGKLDRGKVTNGAYENAYFGMRIDVPENWFVGDPDQDRSKWPYDVDLFQAMAYSPDSNFINNPNVYILAERRNNDPRMNDGGDYLNDLREGLEMIALDNDKIGQVQPVTLAGKPFYKLETYNYDDEEELETFQELYATPVKNYWIVIILTAYDKDELEFLHANLQTLSMR